MASSPTETAMAHRNKTNSDDEPLLTDERNVMQLGESSLVIGLMSEVRKLNDIEKGDQLTVEAYSDRYVVRLEE